VRNTLGELRGAAKEKAIRSNTNIVAPILKAVKAYATIGEICSVLRDAFGENEPSRYF
jgi:methylmalonyl-CoA mutase N-terminal domain/subunit